MVTKLTENTHSHWEWGWASLGMHVVYTRRLDQAFYSPLISLDDIDILSESHAHSWEAISNANFHWGQGYDSDEMALVMHTLSGNGDETNREH